MISFQIACKIFYFVSKYISNILSLVDTSFKRDSFPHLTRSLELLVPKISPI